MYAVSDADVLADGDADGLGEEDADGLGEGDAGADGEVLGCEDPASPEPEPATR
jgi:hypothetical protein